MSRFSHPAANTAVSSSFLRVVSTIEIDCFLDLTQIKCRLSNPLAFIRRAATIRFDGLFPGFAFRSECSPRSLLTGNSTHNCCSLAYSAAFCIQTRAIMLKNAVLAMTERKTWIFKIVSAVCQFNPDLVFLLNRLLVASTASLMPHSRFCVAGTAAHLLVHLRKRQQ